MYLLQTSADSILELATMGAMCAVRTPVHTWEYPTDRNLSQHTNYLHGMPKAITMVMFVIAKVARLCA